MASSFSEQIPIIIHVIQKIAPRTVLDVGKGLGKYGMLLHEYAGISHSQRPIPGRTLKEQSSICLDAIEINTDYDFPHLSTLYRNIIWGNIMSLYKSMDRYDLVLLIDVIEHLPKHDGLTVLKHFVQQGSVCLVSSPKKYFDQNLFQSEWEHHLSHWHRKDFEGMGYVDHQNTRNSSIYLVSSDRRRIIGFGNSVLQKLKRIIWAVRLECS